MTREEEYICNHCTALPAADTLLWIERQTSLRTDHARMLSGPVQGSLLRNLANISGARKILELGTFTGYATICLALSSPDATVDTIEINDEFEDLIREGFERAGVAEKVRLHIGDCKEVMESMLPANAGAYDMIYMDANKREYPLYYPLALALCRKGGIIVADNVLWGGKILQDPLPVDAQTRGIAAFNDMVASDPSVECSLIPIRDGMTIIRKL